MSITSVPVDVRCRLWGKAAGRCQYTGCNTPLWKDDLTTSEFNSAYIAHIIADKPGGARGDKQLSHKLRKDITNLMLLCDAHHRLVDIAKRDEHPVSLLQAMKAEHEARVELVASLHAERKSEMVLYGANIGSHASPLSFSRCAEAMLPRFFPASSLGISLGMKDSANRDDAKLFWESEENHLRNQFAERIRPRLASGTLKHLSIFALAPQPLLILLGHLLNDLPACEVYQKHREPDSWAWQPTEEWGGFTFEEPSRIDGDPALIFSLSATVHEQRIQTAIEKSATTWKISTPKPHNDLLQSSEQLRSFRQICRRAFDRIKAVHGEKAALSIFPAMPAAMAVELGRVRMPKADLPLKIFDQNMKLGGFVPSLNIE